MRARYSLAAVLVLARTSAHADGFVVAEAPAAVAVSDAQQGVFRPGVMPAIGAYVAGKRLALGLRLRGGILRDGPSPGGNFADPGAGGLTTAGLAARIGLGGAWLEVVGGGGVTGTDVVPSVEVGVGWAMPVGGVDIGPSFRYVRVISDDAMASLGSAELALFGIAVQLGKDRPARPAPVPVQVIERPPPPPASPPPSPRIVVTEAIAPPPPVARDADELTDRDTSCVAQLDGCQLTEDLLMIDDRIVLDERVLFDHERSRVKSRGRAIVKDLVRIWREHPEWTRIEIEGHADLRGTDEYNLRLSQRRADRVRALMVKLGCDAAKLSAVGYGRARPRDRRATERAHQRNRRVEFVIERKIAWEVPQ